MPEVVVKHKEQEIGRYVLHAGSINIGRAPGNDILLDSPAIAARHARIVTIEQSCHIHDLATESGTFVNNKQIGRCILKHNDIIRVGHYRILFIDRNSPDADLFPESTVGAREPNQLNLAINPDSTDVESDGRFTGNGIEILNGSNKSKRISFVRPRTALGVGTLKAVVIQESKTQGLSRYNLTAVNPKVAVQINGSYIDHDQTQDLKNGDQIEFLNTILRFIQISRI